jgi:UDP-N-acetyl-2-amino-2-deoxyglucuronate dehydrogenase
MKVGIIGTGAIAHKHAQAYRNIGYEVTVCTNKTREYGEQFAAQYGAEFVSTFEDVCRHPNVDYVDVCTFPDFRLQPIQACVQSGKHVQVQKPMSINLATAREMVKVAKSGGILLNVVSQHRFDDSSSFVAKAIAEGRLGRLLQCDYYAKWYRSPAYYSRAVKGSWATEGGGALINQAIHGVDILRWLAGPVRDIYAVWQLGALHSIESEDVLNAVMRYASGATGVIQASTAVWPGYSERTAIISGDKLTHWDVENDSGDAPPIETDVASGYSDPMAISLTPFERQFRDFGNAIRNKRKPQVSGEEGYAALEIVEGIYDSCRSGKIVTL